MTTFCQMVFASIVGGALTVAGQYVMYLIQTATARRRDAKRKAVLKIMLAHPGPQGWRSINTMSNVIGASSDETARLLVELDARADEKGSGMWAYIRDKPLPSD